MKLPIRLRLGVTGRFNFDDAPVPKWVQRQLRSLVRRTPRRVTELFDKALSVDVSVGVDGDVPESGPLQFGESPAGFYLDDADAMLLSASLFRVITGAAVTGDIQQFLQETAHRMASVSDQRHRQRGGAPGLRIMAPFSEGLRGRIPAVVETVLSETETIHGVTRSEAPTHPDAEGPRHYNEVEWSPDNIPQLLDKYSKGNP